MTWSQRMILQSGRFLEEGELSLTGGHNLNEFRCHTWQDHLDSTFVAVVLSCVEWGVQRSRNQEYCVYSRKRSSIFGMLAASMRSERSLMRLSVARALRSCGIVKRRVKVKAALFLKAISAQKSPQTRPRTFDAWGKPPSLSRYPSCQLNVGYCGLPLLLISLAFVLHAPFACSLVLLSDPPGCNFMAAVAGS